MPSPLHFLTPALAAAAVFTGLATALIAAPTAAADPDTNPTLPQCTDSGGNPTVGTTTTECATPGNVQLDASAPDVPAYSYPWDDEFYGPALIIGGGTWGNHGMR